MGKAKLLTREQVLGARVKQQQIEVPQWGGFVTISELSKESEFILRTQAKGPDGQTDQEKFEKLLFVHCMVEPQFSAEDYDLLVKQAAAPLNLVVTEIVKLNWGSPDANKAFEEQQKQLFPGNNESR